MLLLADFANTKRRKKLRMATLLRVLSENFPMNANMTGLDGFQTPLCPYALDESSLSIGRVKDFSRKCCLHL